MESFRKLPKMKSDIACYKEGGYVSRMKHGHEDNDEAEDKKMVKKAVSQHESAKHKGEEKTELKLKKGGRAKKDAGTVRKYKTGGLTNKLKKGGSCHKEGGAISMEMDKDDKKKIANIKKTKAGKADAPSAGSKKAPGKGVTNMADGGMTPDGGMAPAGQGQVSDAERALMARAAVPPRRRRPMQAINMGVLGANQAAQQAQAAGAPQPLGSAQPSQPMGAATKTGPMGAAAPLGSEQDIMRGLQAIGQYMGGGQVY